MVRQYKNGHLDSDYFGGMAIWLFYADFSVCLKTDSGRIISVSYTHLFTVTKTVISSLVNFFIGFVFACYILLQKEKLSVQIRKVLYAFLPQKAVRQTMKVASLDVYKRQTVLPVNPSLPSHSWWMVSVPTADAL